MLKFTLIPKNKAAQEVVISKSAVTQFIPTLKTIRKLKNTLKLQLSRRFNIPSYTIGETKEFIREVHEWRIKNEDYSNTDMFDLMVRAVMKRNDDTVYFIRYSYLYDIFKYSVAPIVLLSIVIEKPFLFVLFHIIASPLIFPIVSFAIFAGMIESQFSTLSGLADARFTFAIKMKNTDAKSPSKCECIQCRNLIKNQTNE